MENCKLPSDLLINILVRLSVRSLMRLKSVCKFFYNLIKNDHQFMQKHYEFSRTKTCGVLLEFYSADFYNKLYYLVYEDSESNETRCIYLDMPNSRIRYIKCCDGMLCLIVGKGDMGVDINGSEGDSSVDINNITSLDMTVDVFILNPFTMETKVLPSIKVPNKPPNKPPKEVDLHIGFGFGLSNNMAGKVIMLLSFEDVRWDGDGSYEIVMVCSQVDDSWNWRQIDAVPQGPRHFLSSATHDFYLKGKYYWHCRNGDLIWFDMNNEIFGKVKIPFELKTDFITIMNETIVVISNPHLGEWDEGYLNIWLMDENNNIFNWHKQAKIRFPYNLNEYWMPVGIWNPSGHLLVFSSYMDTRYDELVNDNVPFFKNGFGPYLISINLVTQEKKIICTSQEKKGAINIVLNPSGYVQVCKSVIKAQEWNDSNISWDYGAYGRVFNESLKLL